MKIIIHDENKLKLQRWHLNNAIIIMIADGEVAFNIEFEISPDESLAPEN